MRERKARGINPNPEAAPDAEAEARGTESMDTMTELE